MKPQNTKLSTGKRALGSAEGCTEVIFINPPLIKGNWISTCLLRLDSSYIPSVENLLDSEVGVEELTTGVQG